MGVKSDFKLITLSLTDSEKAAYKRAIREAKQQHNRCMLSSILGREKRKRNFIFKYNHYDTTRDE